MEQLKLLFVEASHIFLVLDSPSQSIFIKVLPNNDLLMEAYPTSLKENMRDSYFLKVLSFNKS
jgi:hypothetical protein